MTSRGAEEVEPAWLDEDLPPDLEGDGRDWPGDAAEVAVAAEADGAEWAAVTARLVAAGIPAAAAHLPGAPLVPGVKTGPGGGFGQSEPLDVASPEPALAYAADAASGTGRLFGGVSDDELCGLLGARRRLSARQEWELMMALAEYIRRRPAPGCALAGPGRMPRVWAEGTAAEVSVQLAITQQSATELLGLAWDLAAKLPVTARMLRDGVIDLDKARINANACATLTAEEAGQAERILFATPEIGQKTRTMIRDRIARAVIEVNPGAARKRREHGARDRRIEVRPEVSGNAMMSGRELPALAVLRIDRLLTARARHLRTLGVTGDLDDLRALAFLERFGEADPLGDLTRQATPAPGTPDDDDGGNGDGGNGPEPDGTSGPGGNGGACACGGTGGGLPALIHLTAPALDMTERAGRPGILRGTGPIDPGLVRDLAGTAAKSPRTTYQFTITDPHGRPIAHARGTPGPNDPTQQHKHRKPDQTPGPAPPGTPTLTLIERGPPGTFGTWRYTHGNREIVFEFENLDGPCDHRHQASGHDPGRHLKHLTGILNTECTFPTCRTPQHRADYEHSVPAGQGGITCLCTCGPVCRRNHRNKQQPGWGIQGTGTPGWFTWRLPSGRTYTTGPSIYPI